jgi:hypothetical protein
VRKLSGRSGNGGAARRSTARQRAQAPQSASGHAVTLRAQRVARRSSRSAAIDVSVGCSVNNYSSVARGCSGARADGCLGSARHGALFARRESAGADPTNVSDTPSTPTFSSDHEAAHRRAPRGAVLRPKNEMPRDGWPRGSRIISV